MKYHVKSLLFYKNKIKGKYDNEIIIEASRKDIDDFVSDFFYYEERDGIISIAHTEIKKIYVDMKEKNRLRVDYVYTLKNKEEQAILSTSIKIKRFDYVL